VREHGEELVLTPIRGLRLRAQTTLVLQGSGTLGRWLAAAFFSALTLREVRIRVRLLWPSLVVRP